MTFFRKSMALSLALHGCLLIGLILLTLAKRTREIVVLDEVLFNPTASTSVSALSQPKQEKKLKEEPSKRAVFGVKKNALQSNNPDESTTSVKAGNTTAKSEDDLKLQASDADAIPIPTAPYLVSQMPKLKSEYKIPYPQGARRRNVEGPVIMDILIDAVGKVRQAELVSGPDEELIQAALGAVRSFEFVPARVNESNVAVRIRYSYRFVLE